MCGGVGVRGMHVSVHVRQRISRLHPGVAVSLRCTSGLFWDLLECFRNSSAVGKEHYQCVCGCAYVCERECEK